MGTLQNILLVYDSHLLDILISSVCEILDVMSWFCF